VRDRSVLRVGTNTTYAPMGLFGSDGRTIIGVDPDLGAEIGRVLGVRLEFVDTVFAEVLAKVADGDLDLAMSAVTDTPARATKVDFVNYFSAGTSIVVQRGNPSGVTDIKDLCGKVVTVMGGTVQENLLTRAQTNRGDLPMTVRTYASDSDALVKLRTGRSVAVLNDFPVAVTLVNGPRTSANYQLASNAQYEPGCTASWSPRDQTGLRTHCRARAKN